MTKEQFGKGSPLISMSNIDLQKQNKKKNAVITMS